MKRFLLLVVALCFGAMNLSAQDMEQIQNKIWKDRAKYFNLAYVKQSIVSENSSSFDLKSDWGASLSSGKTFYLHRKPIGRVLKFGLDWTWFDLNAAGYSSQYHDEYDGMIDSKSYQAEIGMQFGPSITVNPVHQLKVGAYFRVTPSYSALYDVDAESVLGGYSTFMNVGATLAWNVLSFGVEYRSGSAKYSDLTGGDEDADLSQNLKTTAVRFYFGFRF